MAKEIMISAELGNVEQLKEIISENKNWHDTTRWISLIDKKGRTPLHLASIYGHVSVAKFIVNELSEAVLAPDLKTEYINLPDVKGRTPLFHAAARGRSYVLRFLIDRGVDMKATTNEHHAAPGSTAIMACAENGHTECFNYLLDKGADLLARTKDGADAFYLAAMNGNVDIVKNIATTDLIRIICQGIIDKPTYRGRTALCTAAFHGHLEVVKLLFKHGAKINHQDQDDFTPLILASYEGHLKLVKWLLRNGADPTVTDKFGDTALQSAGICGHVDVANFILKWQEAEQKDGFLRISIVEKFNKQERFQEMCKKFKLKRSY